MSEYRPSPNYHFTEIATNLRKINELKKQNEKHISEVSDLLKDSKLRLLTARIGSYDHAVLEVHGYAENLSLSLAQTVSASDLEWPKEPEPEPDMPAGVSDFGDDPAEWAKLHLNKEAIVPEPTFPKLGTAEHAEFTNAQGG